MSKPIKVRINLTMRGGHGHTRRIPLRFNESLTNEVELRDGDVVELNVDAWLDFEASQPAFESPHRVEHTS